MAGIAGNGESALRDLKGKIAWITGAGTGIGQAGAVSLARAGMEVVLSGRRRENLEETAALVEKAGKVPVIEELDVADSESVSEVVARIESGFNASTWPC